MPLMHTVLLLIYADLQGIVPVILSWFVSPILAFIATSILFLGVRTLVLRRKNSFNLGCIALPFLVGLTFFVIVVFIIQTGTHNGTTQHCNMYLFELCPKTVAHVVVVRSCTPAFVAAVTCSSSVQEPTTNNGRPWKMPRPYGLELLLGLVQVCYAFAQSFPTCGGRFPKRWRCRGGTLTLTLDLFVPLISLCALFCCPYSVLHLWCAKLVRVSDMDAFNIGMHWSLAEYFCVKTVDVSWCWSF